jgi:hypothetical protein
MKPRTLHVRRLAVCNLLLAAGALVGCGSDPDPAGPDVAGGGQEYVLDYDLFVAAVAPVLESRGCNAEGDCHGGGIRGTFELTPTSAVDHELDFAQAVLQVNGYDPEQSPLLTKPLSETAGGVEHGVTAFDSTVDPGYQAILGWIQAGEFR